jgi:hypothetical protein
MQAASTSTWKVTITCMWTMECSAAHLEHLTGCLGPQLLSVKHPFHNVLPSKEDFWPDGQLSSARQRAQLRQARAARHLSLGHLPDISMTKKGHDSIHDFKLHASPDGTGVDEP